MTRSSQGVLISCKSSGLEDRLKTQSCFLAWLSWRSVRTRQDACIASPPTEIKQAPRRDSYSRSPTSKYRTVFYCSHFSHNEVRLTTIRCFLFTLTPLSSPLRQGMSSGNPRLPSGAQNARKRGRDQDELTSDLPPSSRESCCEKGIDANVLTSNSPAGIFPTPPPDRRR